MNERAEERSSAFLFPGCNISTITIQAMKKRLLPLVVILSVAVTVAAQSTTTPAAASPATTAVNCPSTATLDELVKAINTAVSGPADQDRTCFRDIFYPEARLIPVGKSAADGSFKPHILTVDDWINAVAKRGKSVLGETQIKVERIEWANIAHLWSTYDLTLDGKPGARGINSIQAVYDGKRWRIIEILWQAEDETVKVPAKFLPAGK